MKRIAELVDHIDEELESAKEYAELSLEKKAKSESEWSQRFKEMSNDELKHANYLHDLAVEEIQSLEKFYNPPADMLKVWDESHKKYVEKFAWVKQMLSM